MRISFSSVWSGYDRCRHAAASASRPPPVGARLNCSPPPPAGCSEAVLAAHGFKVNQLVALVRDGLATAKIERMVAGGQPIEIAFVRITEAGQQVLSGKP
jgi:hypothetical protein